MSNIYQHFRPEEKHFIDQVFGWEQQVERTYTVKLTDFLHPREQFILQSVVGGHGDISLQFFGGFTESERKRALLYPYYMEPEEFDFQVGLYEIDYPRKFVKLEHRMVLGSLMSLGLTREKFGDIIVNQDRIQFFAAKEIESFLMTEFNEVGRAKVFIKNIQLDEAIESNERWREIETTVTSYRLDAILARAFSISRQNSRSLIEQKRVTLNWKLVEDPSKECASGDMISVRKFGRCKIIDNCGVTRKNRHRIKIGILK